MTRHLVLLASASPRRRELLGLLGVPFEVVPSDYEEHLPATHVDPSALARDLATMKALEVARRRPEAMVLGADTVVALEDRIYGKPSGPEDAARMLRELSGKEHAVITGVALVPPGAGAGGVRSFFGRTRVRFRSLAEPEIAAYVATGEPLDKAGAYAIQGRGSVLIEEIQGDYANVVGLPLTALALRLRAEGLRVLGLPE